MIIVLAGRDLRWKVDVSGSGDLAHDDGHIKLIDFQKIRSESSALGPDGRSRWFIPTVSALNVAERA